MAKIIPIGNVTKLDIPVDSVLENAKSELEGCILVGYTKDGELYAASTYADGGTVMWMLEACKQLLFDSI